jgi:ribosomal protein S18 acetylase RimI-like enzyme
MNIREATVADAAGIARVHVDSWRATYRGIVPSDHLASLSYEEREARWASILSNPEPGSVVYVATDETGQVEGFAAGGRQRGSDPTYAGELYAIYLLEAYQRQGIGRRLAVAVAERLARSGLSSMLVWVLADNPARTFYAALGGQEVAQQPIEIGGATLSEVAYGWPDVGVLLTRSARP